MGLFLGARSAGAPTAPLSSLCVCGGREGFSVPDVGLKGSGFIVQAQELRLQSAGCRGWSAGFGLEDARCEF